MFNKLFGKRKKQLKEVDDKYVFDKAKFHDNSISEAGLDDVQSFVHSGIFLSWIVRNDLISDYLLKECTRLIKLTKTEKVSPTELYEYLDGGLIGELFNKVGYNFALDYFDFDTGYYVEDYDTALTLNEPDIFRAANTWESYHKIAKIMDSRFEKWAKENL